MVHQKTNLQYKFFFNNLCELKRLIYYQDGLISRRYFTELFIGIDLLIKYISGQGGGLLFERRRKII